MCVSICRCTVGRPSGVPDAGRTRAGLSVFGQFAEIGDSSADFIDLDRTIVKDRDTGGVITSVLQFLKAIRKDRGRLLSSCISDDSTHILFLSSVPFPETLPASSGYENGLMKRARSVIF